MAMSPDFPLTPLERPLALAERSALGEELSKLLRWQKDLKDWPRLGAAPEASPIVSLYVAGRVRGCWAMIEGNPGERLARAFLSALTDLRFGGIGATERAELVVQVSHTIRPRRLDLRVLPAQIVAGVHGLALASRDAAPVLLLPDVARDEELDAEGLLSVLERKAGLLRRDWPRDGLFSFETEPLIARIAGVGPARCAPSEAAADWLVRSVAADGSVPFGLDPRAGKREESGFLRHARAAVAIQALARHPLGHAAVERARRWLAREIELGLSGSPPSDWPVQPPLLAGTLALAALAGVERVELLTRLAATPGVSEVVWHAAQVVAALGRSAPDALWRVCVADLEAHPYAPWTAIAAHRRGDGAVYERAVSALIDTVPQRAIESDLAGRGFVSEPALAALSIEALALSDSPGARAARDGALDMLCERQLWQDTHPAAEPSWVHGAFPLSPNADFLRIDVPGHALLALTAAAGSLRSAVEPH